MRLFLSLLLFFHGSTVCALLFSRSGRHELTLRAENSDTRRKKKNKYGQFSRVDDQKLDPFEQLLEESEKKLEAIDTDKEASRRNFQKPVAIEPLPPIQFMDSKDIDPYDPTSFGYIHLGDVLSAHGVHGWVKVRAASDGSRLCKAGIRHLKAPRKRAPRQVTVVEGKHRHNDEFLLRFQGVEDRDNAQKLRGSKLYIRDEQLAQESEANDDEEESYEVAELVGVEVFLSQGEKDEKQFVGAVGGVVFGDELSSVPLGYDFLEVVLPRGDSGIASFRDELVLIPLVPQIVTEVDLANNQIFIDPPAGLLDLSYVRDDKKRVKGLLSPASEDL